jgi:Fungal protein of unknown function (DUF2015)
LKILAYMLTPAVLYFFRERWIHHLPDKLSPTHLYTALPTTFQGDVEAGLHSADFDMTANIEGDSRSGLDEQGKKEVLAIMRRKKVNFDEARKLYMEKRFKREGISADGLPNDPKFVSFS